MFIALLILLCLNIVNILWIILLSYRYLVTGNSISSIAFSFRVGQSTVRNIIKEVCTVISNTLNALYLTVPMEEEWKLIVDEFWNTWQMLNCFGAVDGKHIKIKCPPNFGSCYYWVGKKVIADFTHRWH